MQRILIVSCLLVLAVPYVSAQGQRKVAMAAGPGIRCLAPQPVSRQPVTTEDKELSASTKVSYPRGHFERGMYLRKKGDNDRALIELLKATQENPRLAKAFYEQALIFQERGYSKLAQSSLEQALAVNPGFQQGRMLLVAIALKQGQITEAVSELSRTLGLSEAWQQEPEKKTIQLDGHKMTPPALLQVPHSALPETRRIPVQSETQVLQAPKYRLVNPINQDSQSHTNSSDQGERLSGGSVNTSNLQAMTAPGAVSEHISNSSIGIHRRHRLRLLPLNPFSIFKRAKASANSKNEVKVHHAQKQNWTRVLREAKCNKSMATEVAMQKMMPKRRTLLSQLFSFWHHEENVMANATAVQSNLQDDWGVKTTGADANRALNMALRQPSISLPEAPSIRSCDSSASEHASSIGVMSLTTPLTPPDLRWIPSSVPSANNGPKTQSALNKPKPGNPLADDAWAIRLRYLAEHGTALLKKGEAFMFSEETGEAVLFLPNGESVRRKIAQPKDADEVVRMRRPDIMTPGDLQYNLSLLGKLLPKQTEHKNESGQELLSNLNVNDVLTKSNSFWDWLKQSVHF